MVRVRKLKQELKKDFLWKWALSRFKAQKDIFIKEERLQIYELMKKEFNI